MNVHPSPFVDRLSGSLGARIFLTVVLLCISGSAHGLSCSATGSGNWSNIATWSCGQVPTLVDDVSLSLGGPSAPYTVTVDVAAVANSVTVFSDNGASATLAIAAGRSLTVAGGVTVSTSLGGDSTLDVGDGTLTLTSGILTVSESDGDPTSVLLNNGSIDVSGNIGLTAGCDITVTGTGTITTGGTFSGGTFAAGSGLVAFTGVSAAHDNAYTFHHVEVASGANLGTGGLTLTGDLTNDGTIFDTDGGIVVFSGTNQTLDGVGTIQVPINVSLSGILTIASTADQTLPFNPFSITTGTVDNQGVARLLDTTTSLTAPSSATWTQLAGSTLILGGAIDPNVTLVATASPNTVHYQGTGQTVRGTTYDNLTIEQTSFDAVLGGSTTVNGTLAVTTGVLDDGGFQLSAGGSAILQLDAGTQLSLGDSTNATTLPDFSSYTIDPGSTVEFQATPDQTINASVPYGRVVINNGRKTFDGTPAVFAGELYTSFSGAILDLSVGPVTLTVDGDLTGGGTVDLGAGEIRVGGDWCVPGGDCNGPTLAPNTGTVTYNGLVDQVLNHSAPYFDLKFENTGAAYLYGYIYGMSISVDNSLVLQPNATVNLDGITFDGNTTATMSLAAGSDLQLGDDGSSISEFPVNFAAATLDPASTVTYDAGTGAGQLVSTDVVYGNLLVTAPPGAIETKLVSGTAPTLDVVGDLTVQLGAPGDTVQLDMNGFDLDAAGDILGDGDLLFAGDLDGMIVGGSFDLTGSFSPPGDMTFTGSSLTPPGTLPPSLGNSSTTISGGTYQLNSSATFFTSTLNITAPAAVDLVSGTLDAGDLAIDGTVVDGIGGGSVRVGGLLSGAGSVGSDLVLTSTVTSSGSPSVSGNLDLAFFSSSSLTNNGTLSINGDIVGDGFSSQLFAGNGSTLSIGGTISAMGLLDFQTNPNLVIYDGGAQTVASSTYHDLQLSGSGTKTALASLSIDGDLTIDTGVTLDVSTNSAPLIFTAAGTHAFSAVQPVNLFDLQVQQSTSIVAGTDTTVDNSLILDAGVLTIPPFDPLLLKGTISQTTGVVNGPIIKEFASAPAPPFTFPFGDGTRSMPVTVTVDTIASPPGQFQIAPIAGPGPSAPAGSLNAYWDITTDVDQADVVFTWDDLDVVGDESTYVLARRDGSQWIAQNASVNQDANTASLNDVTQFSPWTLVPNAACQVISTADSGPGTLRQAILDANATTCSTITFAIAGTGPHTISLLSDLVLSADNVLIDGFTQSGASANTGAFGAAVDAVHQIRITQGGTLGAALQINGSGNTVQGLWFDGISAPAILVFGTTTDSNVAAGNLFTSVSRGIVVSSGTGNVIGGATPAERNVFDNLADDAGGAIWSDGSSSSTQIKGNYLGLDATGAPGLGVDGFGINIQGANNVVVDQNVVAQSGRTTLAGIRIAADGATVTNNRIGTTADGMSASPNGSSAGGVGIWLDSGTGANLDGNLISGHDAGGFAVMFASNGTTPLETGIYVKSTNGTFINNKIGTDLTGAGSIPNRFGIMFDTGATGNIVGGGLGANTIMNNVLDGIVAVDGSGNKWVDNVINANGALAVDLDDDDVVNDDAGDADTGANGLQNPPTITEAILSGGTLYARVSLDSSTPNPAGLLIEIVETDAGGQIVAPVGSACLAGSVLVNDPVILGGGSLSGGTLIAALATSYSDPGCASGTVADGSSEVGASFAVVANTAPVAGNDAPSTPEDTPVTFAAGSNDSDGQSGVFFVSSTAASNGTATCSAYPNCTYTPNANYNGPDSFSYTIQDAHGLTATATVTVTVNAVNDAPVAVANSYATGEDTPLTVSAPGVLGNDTDVDLDTLSAVLDTDVSNGTLALNGDGSFTYTPGVNYNGTDSFTYHAFDGTASSNIVTVTITIGGANDNPVAVDDTTSTNEDTPVTVLVLSNDSDADGDTVTISGFTNGSNGAVSCTASDCTYTPAVNFNGSDSFTYSVADGNGGTDSAAVTVTVIPINDLPVAVADSFAVAEDTTLSVAAPGVLGNDSDVDLDSLSAVLNTDVSNGTLTLNADGSFTYTPDLDFIGTDSFTYHAFDGTASSNNVTVTLNVGGVNDNPVPVDDSTTTSEDTPVTVAVLSNDSDPDGDSLTVSGSTNGSNGTVTCTLSDCTYTPGANFNGSDSFTYSVTDGNGGTAIANVAVTVTPVNDAPVAVGDGYALDENTSLSVPAPGVLGNDADVDLDSLTAVLDGNVSNGTLTLNPNGSFSYTPSPGFIGTDGFSYHAFDGAASSSIVTVNLNVGGVNGPPVAADDSATTAEDTMVVVNVLSNDTDPDGDSLIITSATNGTKGSVTCTASDCKYTPSVNFNGNDSFNYSISDGNGGTDTATVFVTVTSVNDPPVAVDDTKTTAYQTPVAIAVLANDSDPDGGVLSIAAVGSPANGTVTCTSGGCTYTPDPGFSGIDSFTYTVSDGQGGTSVGTVTITVTAEIVTDLKITKTGPPRAARAQAVEFTIKVENLGPGDAFDVQVHDPAAEGLIHAFNTGDCTTPFPCQLGTLAPGEIRTINATFVIGETAPQTVTNIATVSTTSTEADSANNSASASVSVCPVTPENLLPASGATGVPVSGQLTWSESGATTYTVFLGPAGGGCSTQYGQSATNSLVYSDLEPGTQYEWRVVAAKSGCQQMFTQCQTFTTGSGACPTGQPQLIEPAAASTQTAPVTFVWTAVDGAIGYDVIIDQGGGPHVIVSTSETSATVAVPPGPVSWLVEAHFDGCPSTQSAGSSFTVEDAECSDEAPAIVAPADGTTGLDSPVQFMWTAVSGASSYRVWVEAEDSFPVVVGTTSATSLIATVPSGELHWYVQALFEGCPPTISPVVTIQVDTRANCPQGMPELIAPAADLAVDSPVVFEWTPVAGAVRYAVWASVDGDTESVIGTTEGETAVMLERVMDPGQIDWFVEVFYDGCPPVKTGAKSFIVNEVSQCQTEAPQLLLPAEGATGQPGLVKFQWQPVPTAVGYRLWVRTDGVGEFEMEGATLAETELQVPLRGNLVEWYVEAVFDGCLPTRSVVRSFMIEPAQVCHDDASELIMPIGGVTVSENRVNLVWTAVDGADAYNVWVSRENGAQSRVGLTSGDELSIEVDLDEGDHEWWVTALFGGCSPVDSDHATFAVDTGVPDECDSNSELLLLSPSEGAANIVSPVIFEWTEVPGATGYQIWLLDGESDTPRALGGMRQETQAVVQIPVGTVRWYVEAFRSECPPIRSAIQHFKVKPAGLECGIPDKPLLYVPQNVTSGTEYRISWDQVPGATIYEVQESTSAGFRGLPVRVVRGTSTSFLHELVAGSETYFYRVRALGDCNGERGSYSRLAAVTIDASSSGPSASSSYRGYRIAAEDLVGSEILELNKDAYSQNGVEEFTVVLRSPGAEPETVRLIPDQSWITVDPEVVTLTPGGVTVTIRAEMGDLPLGTSSATLRFEPVGGKGASQGGTVPVSVSLVTPVAQSGKNKPLPESLIIPAVAHADGVNSTWLSDIRLTNVGAVTQKYQINFTPAGVDGTQTGQTTTLDVKPGSTVALNDVLANWYGTVEEDSQTGMLEIRPMKSSTSSSIGGLASVAAGGFTNLASSRTYNFTPNGTFGQFIPAIRFENFVGIGSGASGASDAPRLSMQQVSQSEAFRTNLGIVEASGNAVDALVKVFDHQGGLVGSFTVNLQPGEHKQLNLQSQGISVENGRIEITAAGGQGQLMAYGSVVDNATNDPQLVPAVTLGKDSGTKWVLPGVADLDTGQASWRTDVRILNAEQAPRTVKLTYYPQNEPGVKKEAELTLNAGEIEVLDDLLASFFGETNTGGVVHVETDASSNLVTTGRTYNLEADGGTFGQFIPAVNAAQAVGRGERALQVLQVEQSDRFRANLGLAEVSGQPAQVEVTAVVPGSKASISTIVTLQGNEFTQLVGVLNALGISEAYNARISVRVVNGNGRIVAYGSVVDNQTQDPTYVPAQ